MGNAINPLKNHLKVIYDLQCASRVLGWDQQTQMPSKGVI
jgi:Zn-dependent M32 family carboxypeptidase